MADPKTEKLIDEYGKALYEFRAAEDAHMEARRKADLAFEREQTAHKASDTAARELRRHLAEVVFPAKATAEDQIVARDYTGLNPHTPR